MRGRKMGERNPIGKRPSLLFFQILRSSQCPMVRCWESGFICFSRASLSRGSKIWKLNVSSDKNWEGGDAGKVPKKSVKVAVQCSRRRRRRQSRSQKHKNYVLKLSTHLPRHAGDECDLALVPCLVVGHGREVLGGGLTHSHGCCRTKKSFAEKEERKGGKKDEVWSLLFLRSLSLFRSLSFDV